MLPSGNTYSLRVDIVKGQPLKKPPEHQQKRKEHDPISIKEKRLVDPASRQGQGRSHHGYRGVHG